MSAEVAPSGDVYASASQVARLEEIVLQQQQQIASLLNERTLFQQDFKTFLDQQLQRAAGQRGAKGHEAMSTHTFLTTELTSAVQQIRNELQGVIQESIPLKKLQALEQRLLAKPTASADLQSLAVRISHLESRPQVQVHHPHPTPSPSLTSSEEFQRLQQHVAHLEDLLLKEVQKAHKTASGKTGELGAPLQRLQAQVNQLLVDVQQSKALDGQKLAEALLTTKMKAFKEEIGAALEAKASNTELERIQQTVDRIEAFSRDVQINVLQVSNAQQNLDKDLREQFSEARWSVVSNGIKAAAKATLDEQQASMKAYVEDQHTKALEQIAKAEQITKQLDTDVRKQYGPEMLQRHLQTLQTTLQTDQQTQHQTFQTQITSQLTDMAQQIQSHRQHSLDVAADIKSQLQASELAKRYKAFEETLIKHESTFASFQKRYDAVGSKLEEQVRKAEAIQNDVSDQILGLEQSLTAMAQTIRAEQQQMRQQITSYATQWKHALDEQFKQYASEVQNLKDALQTTAQEIETTKGTWKEEQAKWSQEGTTLHTQAQQTLKTWMEQQESYLYGRVADMSGRLQSLQTTVEHQNEDVKRLISDETLQQFVSEIERRVRHTQDEWGQRRVLELGLKFSEYEKTLQQTATEIQDRQASYGEEVRTTLRNLQTQQDTLLHKAILDTRGEVREIAKRCDTTVQESLDSLKLLVNDVQALQEAYRTQTDRAVKEEDYKAFQSQVQKQFEGFRTDTNSRLFHALTQYKTEATQMLTQLKESQHILTKMVSEESLAVHIQTIETQVRNDLNSWQKTVQSSIRAQQTTISDSFDSLRNVFDTLESSLYSSLSEGLVEGRRMLDLRGAEFKTQIEEVIQRVYEKGHVLETTVQTRLDSSLSHLRRDFLNGIQTVLDMKESSAKIEERLRRQLDEAMTQEKYAEYQKALESRIHDVLTTTQTTLETVQHQCTEAVKHELEQMNAQSKSWAQMFSENRLRQFVEAIEKRLRAQQENWTARRKEEFQESFQSMKQMIDTYTHTSETSMTISLRTEATLRTALEKIEKDLQEKQSMVVLTHTKALERVQADVDSKLQEYDVRWEKKQSRIDEQVSGWIKQILAVQSQQRTDLTEQVQSHQTDMNTFKSSFRETVSRTVANFDRTIDTILTKIEQQRGDYLQLMALVKEIQNTTQRSTSDQREVQLVSSTSFSSESEMLRRTTWMEDERVKPTKLQGRTKCFYTALIGVPGQQTDTLSKIPKLDGWDCICFTNLPQPETTGWTIVPVTYTGTQPAVEAKKYKWLSHNFLAEYDIVVWVDAYLAPSNQNMPILNQILTTMIQANLLICHRPHTERKCIWQECDAVVKSKRDTEPNVARVRKLLQDGKMPTNWGLFDTNILIRFHKHEAVQTISEAIFKQISTVSSRDQLAVTLQYYTMGFKAFTTQPLSNLVTRTGTHIRIAV